jgi:hypothetical protein
MGATSFVVNYIPLFHNPLMFEILISISNEDSVYHLVVQINFSSDYRQPFHRTFSTNENQSEKIIIIQRQIKMADEAVFIVDIGSSSVKAGFSGEDMPSYIMPSCMTKFPAKNLEVRR